MYNFLDASLITECQHSIAKAQNQYLIKIHIMTFIFILLQKQIHLVYIFSSFVVHYIQYVHNKRKRLGRLLFAQLYLISVFDLFPCSLDSREGRATMVSAFASFKFGVAFCFTQLISVLMVFYVRRNFEKIKDDILNRRCVIFL